MSDTDFALKYRPKTLEKVVGHPGVVKSLRTLLEKRRKRSFLFTGPAGTGKTTLGRIIAREVGCERGNLVEVDAASNTGIDAMRAITEGMHFGALGESGVRVYIIDEAHRLSAQAWDSLLKSVEEPPRHVYWVFCSSMPSKIPKAIVTRCAAFDLKPVPSKEIYGLLERVVKKEELKTPEDVLELIAQKCEGSPRQALCYLSLASDCEDRKEAAQLISSYGEEGDIIELCRALVKGTCRWEDAMRILAKVKDQNPEGMRIVICNYFQSVILGKKDPRSVAPYVAVLDAFKTPYPQTNGVYPLILSLADLLLD